MKRLRTTNPDGTPREMVLGFERAKLQHEVEKAVKRSARKMVEGKGDVRHVALNLEADLVFPKEWLPRVIVFLAQLMLEEHAGDRNVAML